MGNLRVTFLTILSFHLSFYTLSFSSFLFPNLKKKKKKKKKEKKRVVC